MECVICTYLGPLIFTSTNKFNTKMNINANRTSYACVHAHMHTEDKNTNSLISSTSSTYDHLIKVLSQDVQGRKIWTREVATLKT